jgi:DNA ligase 1
MRVLARLLERLADTSSTSKKVELLTSYFAETSGTDRDWSIFLLAGETVPRALSSTDARRLVGAVARIPDWLVDECYHTVGDLAETLSLLLPQHDRVDSRSVTAWMEFFLALRKRPLKDKRLLLFEAWSELDSREYLLFHKLLTGGFRVGVSKGLVTKALARVTGRDEGTIAHLLTGALTPGLPIFARLQEGRSASSLQPYPFALAVPMDVTISPEEALGACGEWLFEYKWDGIRAQMVRREGGALLFSRGEEYLTERFPELNSVAQNLPVGTVLDGEIVVWRETAPGTFVDLQTRITRKRAPPSLMKRHPVRYLAYDLIEESGRDLRDHSLSERRALLNRIVEDLRTRKDFPIDMSQELTVASWDDAARFRLDAPTLGAEGLMVKRRDAAYHVGRKRAGWVKWKVDPYVFDGVLTYAQKGHGRRSELYTDYTFGVWDGPTLVTVAKAYSGLTDEEIQEVDRFVRSHTKERFGPVRTVTPQLVFEIAFEGIQYSPRHKSGFALRFPRISRWRRDKKAQDADTLETLSALLKDSGTALERGRLYCRRRFSRSSADL